jgi:hypothetical protein
MIGYKVVTGPVLRVPRCSRARAGNDTEGSARALLPPDGQGGGEASVPVLSGSQGAYLVLVGRIRQRRCCVKFGARFCATVQPSPWLLVI